MKALITGISGFIGTHVAQSLVQRGATVKGLVRPTSRYEHLQPLDIEFVRGDVTNLDSLVSAVAGVDVVFHLAGAVKAFSYDDFRRVNERGVRNMAAACAARTTPPVLVVVSSLAAAGPAPHDRLRSETDPPQPVSNYGRSKRAGELAAEAWASQVPVTIVRPAMVFGEWDSLMLEMFRPIVRTGIHPVPGFGSRRVSLIHADDLASALVQAAERGRRLASSGSAAGTGQGYYFAAANDCPTLAELGQLIAKAVGRRSVLIFRAPKCLSQLAAIGNELLARVVHRPAAFSLDKVREAFAGSWICSAERARHDLGFSVPVPLSDRLRQTAQWYTSQGCL